jgi:hypothetical protein
LQGKNEEEEEEDNLPTSMSRSITSEFLFFRFSFQFFRSQVEATIQTYFFSNRTILLFTIIIFLSNFAIFFYFVQLLKMLRCVTTKKKRV